MSESNSNHYPTDFPFAYGRPALSAGFRVEPEDFVVEEQLPFTPSGEGEHVFLFIQKRNLNTEDVVRRILRLTGLRPVNVGYAGQKDRRAVTRQWFSVHLPKGEADWHALNEETALEVVSLARHNRKLQKGALSGNRFEIRLRNVHGDETLLKQRLKMIAESGVPNYFGEQRFGREGRNLPSAQAMFEGKRIKSKHQRSMLFSAARSYVFNQVLAARVAAGSWDRLLPGDALQLAGTKSFFVAESIDADIQRRFASADVLPTGPLWGKGEPPTCGEVKKLEMSIAQQWPLFCEGLAQAGMKQERRALQLNAQDLSWEIQETNGGKDLLLRFFLPAGTYATAILRELVVLQ